MKLTNESQPFLKEKRVWAETLGHSQQSIKAILGWKFRVQDLLYEPEVLPMSLAYLVARMGWAHAKVLKGTDSYPPNHTSSISPISRMDLGHA